MKQEYGTQMMSFPKVLYHFKGGRYSMEFLIDQRKTDVFGVVVSALSIFDNYREKSGFRVINTKSLRNDEILTFIIDFEEFSSDARNRLVNKGTLYITGELVNDRPAVKFILEKTDKITEFDIKAFLDAYLEANRPVGNNKKSQNIFPPTTSQFQEAKRNAQKKQQSKSEDIIKKLEDQGLTVFKPNEKEAGYEKQKREIEDSVLLALMYPQIFEEITEGTRMKQETNRPRAILFEGPPGTGKTTSAKIIAQQVKIPLIYMPLESIMSKYYGEAEKQFAEVFDNCKQLGKSILFIDEIDSLAQSRSSDMHETSRRLLSILLRKIDSFESNSEIMLIAATNRKEDLDPAMISRIDLSIKFDIPDEKSRAAIFQRYAKHLRMQDLESLAQQTQGYSGRTISNICKLSERKWASKIIRKEVSEKLPNYEQYLESLNEKKINEQLIN